MKRMFALLTGLVLMGALTACGGSGVQSNPGQSQTGQEGASSVVESSAADPSASTPASKPEGGVLVVYFSATGNTRGIAQHLQAVLDADLYEIVPQVPYTSDDLNYSNDSCRANQEQNDPMARPAISGTLENPDSYDVMFLGYPIWWGQAPKILCTFLESYDLDGVTIVPFCTSGSSGIGGSLEELQALAPNARWMDGQRFDSGADQNEVAQWVDSLGLGL